MTGIDFTLYILALLVLANYRISRSVLYPPFLFCLMWLMDLALYRTGIIDIAPLHSKTLGIIAAGAILFSVGGRAAFLIPASLIKLHIAVTGSKRRSRRFRSIVLGAICIGALLVVYHTFKSAELGSGTGLMMRARNAALEGTADVGNQHEFSIYAYLLHWVIFGTIMLQVERNDRTFRFAAVIAFIGCIVSTGRETLLMFVAALTCVHLIKTNRMTFSNALKFARWPILIFISMYIVLVFTNRDTSGYSGGIAGVIVFFVVSYIVGPTAAFDHVVVHYADYVPAPEHTFKFFLGMASDWHLIQYTRPEVFDTFIFVPFPTNVYTVYKFYFTDFGLYGLLATMFVIGFLHCALYRKAKTGSELGIYLFALTMNALLIVIFDDLYSSFGVYLDALFFASIYMVLRTLPLRLLPQFHSPQIEANMLRSSPARKTH